MTDDDVDAALSRGVAEMRTAQAFLAKEFIVESCRGSAVGGCMSCEAIVICDLLDEFIRDHLKEFDLSPREAAKS